jgi:hypothetical protein
MKEGYVLLTEKDEMWARMLMDVLTDNGIPCTSLPVHGIGLVMRTMAQERLKVFVPADLLDRASELTEALFSENAILEEEE